MKCVFICLIIPFVSFTQSNIEQKLLGIWEYSQENQFLKSDEFNKRKFTLEFREKGICLYPYASWKCGNEIPRIKSGKYVLNDSVLTIELMNLSKMIILNLKILKISDKSLICKSID